MKERFFNIKEAIFSKKIKHPKIDALDLSSTHETRQYKPGQPTPERTTTRRHKP